MAVVVYIVAYYDGELILLSINTAESINSNCLQDISAIYIGLNQMCTKLLCTLCTQLTKVYVIYISTWLKRPAISLSQCSNETLQYCIIL